MWEDERKPTITPPNYASHGYTSSPQESEIEPENAIIVTDDDDEEPHDGGLLRTDVHDDSTSMELDIDVELECHDSSDIPKGDDIAAFWHSLNESFQIFMQRRNKYGNHLNNAVRFPLEDIAGLYLKCVRMVRMIEEKYDFAEPIDDDTLLDLPNYAHLIRSRKDG
jgi:hypothetical protein